MCEHCSDGSSCRASMPRFARYAKMSERKAWKTVQALRKRGILTQLAKGNPARMTPSIFRINEAAFKDDPAMAAYREDQQLLPGITRPWEPKIPDMVTDPSLVHTVHQGGEEPKLPVVHTMHQASAQLVTDLVHSVHQGSAHCALDSKPYIQNPDSKPSDSQPSQPKRGVCTLLPADATTDTDTQTHAEQPLAGQVREIAALHPKVRDAFHLTQDVYKAVQSAIARDGRDVVWVGTKSMADAVARWPREELRFVSSPVNFFRESHYRADPAEWERKGGKADEQQRIFEREREILRRRQSGKPDS